MPYVAGGAVVVVLALFIALLSASGFLLGQMLVAGVLIGGLLLMLPMTGLMVFLLVVTFVIQGTLSYFLRFSQAAWLPYLLCLLIAVRTVQLGNGARAGVESSPSGGALTSGPFVFLGLYLAGLLVATVVNRPPLVQVIIGLKSALPMWIGAALVYQGASQAGFSEKLWTLLRAIFFLQLPVALYQHFVIVPSRRDADTTGMDAVVGTFGGQMDAGGANSTLVIFSLLVMGYQLALWARGRARWRSVLLYWMVGLAIILSGEVKAAFVWLPVLIFYVMRRRILSSFGTAIASVLVSALLVGGLFTAYTALYWQKIAHHSDADLITSMGYFFDTRNIDYTRGQVSRGASLALWAGDLHTDAPRRLIGHGPGASRISATGGLGEVAQRFAPLNIAATGAAMMLWDVGLFGLLSFMGILATAAWLLWRLSDSVALRPSDQAAADAFGGVMLVFLSLVIYNRSLNDEASIQLLLAVALGYALHWRRVHRTVSPVRRGGVRPA